MCVLNGRVTPQFDNFTSVSVKGSAIVDYIAAPHCSLNICKSFKVNLARGDMEHANVYNTKIPDHSILELVFSPHCYAFEDQIYEDSNDHIHNGSHLREDNQTLIDISRDK